MNTSEATYSKKVSDLAFADCHFRWRTRSLQFSVLPFSRLDVCSVRRQYEPGCLLSFLFDGASRAIAPRRLVRLRCRFVCHLRSSQQRTATDRDQMATHLITNSTSSSRPSSAFPPSSSTTRLSFTRSGELSELAVRWAVSWNLAVQSLSQPNE